jgi:hypothetical protein
VNLCQASTALECQCCITRAEVLQNERAEIVFLDEPQNEYGFRRRESQGLGGPRHETEGAMSFRFEWLFLAFVTLLSGARWTRKTLSSV